MTVARLCLYFILLIVALTLGAYLFAVASNAQARASQELKRDMRRAFSAREELFDKNGRRGGHVSVEASPNLGMRPPATAGFGNGERQSVAAPPKATSGFQMTADTANTSSIAAGTSLSRILHISQLSLVSSAGTDEQYVDRTGDLVADERTTLDNAGGSFHIAVAKSVAR